MKLIFAVLFIVITSGAAFAKDVTVKGHYRDSDGDGIKETYVKEYHRTSPDSNIFNNYSTKNNYNPYNGTYGTVDPYKNTNSNKNSNQYKTFYSK